MRVEDAAQDAGFSKALEAALLDDLRAASVQAVNSRIDLAIKGQGGALIAGLAGATSYGWLRVNMLWVSEAHRRAGLGHQLMQRAFDTAHARGCHACWLETSNPQAQAFYVSLGFEAFGVLKNDIDAAPQTHARWFLKRTLPPSNKNSKQL
jgi:ribosomal protein S18 acetylase RimI-like enzyme